MTVDSRLSLKELLIAICYEQEINDRKNVPIERLKGTYGFNKHLDRLVHSLIDNGLARPSVFDAVANSTTLGLTNEGERQALMLITSGHTVEKKSDSQNADGSYRNARVPAAEEAAAFRKYLLHVQDMRAPPPEVLSDGPSVGARLNNEIEVESSSWTGKQLILVDAKAIEDLRLMARELQTAVYELRIENNFESSNLKGLADALVSICDMAEPETTIIQRILASPNFKSYVGLFTIVATIRGAFNF